MTERVQLELPDERNRARARDQRYSSQYVSTAAGKKRLQARSTTPSLGARGRGCEGHWITEPVEAEEMRDSIRIPPEQWGSAVRASELGGACSTIRKVGQTLRNAALRAGWQQPQHW